jgi:hypothetical protein
MASMRSLDGLLDGTFSCPYDDCGGEGDAPEQYGERGVLHQAARLNEHGSTRAGTRHYSDGCPNAGSEQGYTCGIIFDSHWKPPNLFMVTQKLRADLRVCPGRMYE